MKKHENSSVSIKQIMFTTVFLMVATLGGLNAYRIVCHENAETIPTIESANLSGDTFETALVENTEDDFVYSERLKFLAANEIVERNTSNENTEVATETKENTRYLDKVISRGNYVRERVADEILSNTSKDENQTLLNTVLNEVKELGEIPEDSNSENSANQKEEIQKTTSNQTVTEEVNTQNSNSENANIENANQEIANTEVANTENLSENNVENAVTEIQEETTIQDNTNHTQELAPPINYVRTIDVKATAYCLCKKCCGKSPSSPGYGVTASGLKIIPGTGMKVVASDPSVIPLGTKVYIEGLNGASDYGYATVADTGSAIKNLKIDLYMDTHQMALNWGVKSVRVYILAD